MSGQPTPLPGPATTTPTPSSPTDADGWEQIGTSVQGRPIRVKTIGHGPRKVLFVGGIHGDEPEGAYATAELPATFTGAGLTDAVTFTILEDANPDGRANGTRGNANGVDLNRNFPAKNFDTSNPAYGGSPLSQPESRALYDTIRRSGPDLVLVTHSWAGRHFINFDGPARPIAERFSADSGLPVEESSSFAPTPGSLGSYVGRDNGTPILTIELLKGSDPKADWVQIRTALLHAIGG
jgi:murein peptide amidase A